ncbi:hypothetical protein C100_02560 [Sphingobium sp. C100]|nr:hypothetical protein C100_02560 [Sphingobium sp. C100]
MIMPDFQDIVADPHFMPVGVSADMHTIRFARVSVESLRAQAFLDGRSPYTHGPETAVAIDELAPVLGGNTAPSRVLLHVSFCGSTLLSNLLDVEGQSLGLREPAGQIELADALRTAPERVSRATHVVEALLSRTIEGHVPVIKPSNWANNLLPIWIDETAIDPIFMTIAPRLFLRAVFRGGRDRLAYAIRLAQHLAPSIEDGAGRLSRSIAAPPDPLQKAARLSLLALSFQLTLFQTALKERRWGKARVITFDQLENDPVGTAIRVADILQLPVEVAAIRRGSKAVLERHAKVPGRRFAASEAAEANRLVEQHHSATFDSAFAWASAEELCLEMPV